MERRQVLGAIGTTVFLPLFGGCLANSPRNSIRTEQPENTSEDDPSPSVDSQGPVRGESTIDLQVREVEDDETVEYIETDDAVRYVAGWRSTNPEDQKEGEPPEREPFFETTPFDRWAETKCLSAAARTAAEHVNEELDVQEVRGGVTSRVAGHDRAAFVSITTILDREGDAVHETDVEFEALVAATPTVVEVTYVLDEQVREMDVPVYARSEVQHQA